MVRDYFIPMNMTGLPTVRETDGLAMSSRNKYLNMNQRNDSLIIHKSMLQIRETARPGANTKELIDSVIGNLSKVFQIDYFEIRNQESLELDETLNSHSRIFFAGKINNIRLIDNMAVFGEERPLIFKG